ncbi:unnamed protein product [Adineta steineri]|uniref:Uncharacterized protein n=1 Tax=Adineta steineri TaxID=433720 RepID=A0A815FIN0_9BILA|nr:unnamed protein product [Adineta steineri]CAF4084124.1 unnamed protein product [Adineta steineri]
MNDVDILLNEHKPNICILTGVGAASRKLPEFVGYTGISQIGTNSYGGVAILHENFLKCKIIDKELNFILIEVETALKPILIGAVYVPPALEIRQQSLPPNHPDLGGSYNNIGHVYQNMENYSKAHSFYELAVQIGQQSLPANHPHLQGYRKSLERMKKKL